MTPEQWGRLTPPQQAAFIARYGPPPPHFHRAAASTGMPPTPHFAPRVAPSRRPPSHRLWLAAGLGAVTLIVVVGIGWALLGSQTITTTGSLVLHGAYGAGSKMAIGAYPCVGTDGYDDIAQGATVTVYDDAGKVVATSVLDEGKALGDTGSCAFTMQIDGIPDGSKFYQVEVSHRGKVTFSRDDVVADKIALTLGHV